MSNEFEITRYIVRLKEERDIKVKAIKNYAVAIEKMYNDEIEELENTWKQLHS